jgi:hypothetical protein
MTSDSCQPFEPLPLAYAFSAALSLADALIPTRAARGQDRVLEDLLGLVEEAHLVVVRLVLQVLS